MAICLSAQSPDRANRIISLRPNGHPGFCPVAVMHDLTRVPRHGRSFLPQSICATSQMGVWLFADLAKCASIFNIDSFYFMNLFSIYPTVFALLL
jgi:hypothetical protein